MEPDVIIVGGGLNGPLTALALASVGISAEVIDPNPAAKDAGFDGRAYALAASSLKVLMALGLWDALKPHAQPITDIKVSSGEAGAGAHPWFLHFDHTEIEDGPLGAMVEDRHLRTLLSKKVSVTKGTIIAQNPEPGRISVTLNTGENRRAALLIGCDGRKSGTAQRAGISRQGWDYDQASLVATLEHEHPHHGCAHQFFMPAGPLAILPLTQNRSSIVWTESLETAAHLNALPDADFLDYLRPRFGDFLGHLALTGTRYSYPLGLSIAERFTADRIALVGDAAHGIHPLAGQGLNLGIRDIAALAETLAQAKRRGEDIASATVLARYQSWRRFDANALGFVTDTVNRLFSTTNPILKTLRTTGLGLLNQSPTLRQRMMREAAGLTGDLPKLMRGRSI